jgi:hypothetical protein
VQGTQSEIEYSLCEDVIIIKFLCSTVAQSKLCAGVCSCFIGVMLTMFVACRDSVYFFISD